MNKSRGFLVRVLRDTHGSTLAIMAAMLIPLLALSGAAVDTARLYVVKVRLQQACDAGTLAGRKAMTDTATATPLDGAAAAQAQTFFKNNFRSGWFLNVAPVFIPTKGTAGSDSTVANAVNGTATVTVPMTVMSMFGSKPRTIGVTCQAIYDLADTDVMFVLDTTGSMSVTPSTDGENGTVTYTRDDGNQAYMRKESSGSKIDALRQAVILFDKTMTQNKQTDTKVRYGFSPYSTVVNIGKLLDASTVGSNLRYNSRATDGDYDYVTSVTQASPMTSTECLTKKRYPASGYGTGFSYKKGSNTVTVSGYYGYVNFTGAPTWSSSTCTGTATIRRPIWKYGPVAVNVSQYLTFTKVPTPGRIDGSQSLWRGCVEITSVSSATSLSASSLPSDLDPDVMPTWRPM